MGSCPSNPTTCRALAILTQGRPAVHIPDPECRGILLSQLEDLVEVLYSSFEPADEVNLYELCECLIKPLTVPARCSYVERIAESIHLQMPSFFVSHWWGESVVASVKCIQKHAFLRGRSKADAYWICAYANNQHDPSAEIGDSPSKSPFFKAMQLSEGVLLILDQHATPFKRMWCCYEESVVVSEGHRLLLDIACAWQGEAELLTDGLTANEERMEQQHRQVVHNVGGWAAKGQREANFPVELIQEGLRICISQASASREEDRRRILNSIAGQPDLDSIPDLEHPAYSQVDERLHSIFALAAWRRALDTPLGPAVGAALRSDRGRRRLTLHFSGLQGFMDRHLEQMASCLPSGLEHVRLHFEECPLTDLAPLWQNLQRLESCAHLDLNFAFCKELRSLRGFADTLQGLRQLRSLTLQVEGCNVAALDMNLASSPLRELRLYGGQLPLVGLGLLQEGLGSSSLEHLTFDFSSCHHLESIAISNWPRSLHQLELCFPRCPRLEVPASFWQTFMGLQDLRDLKLNFAHCRGVLDGGAQLLKALKALSKLERLKLNFYYCSSLSPHLQWAFEDLVALEKAVAKGHAPRSTVDAESRRKVSEQRMAPLRSGGVPAKAHWTKQDTADASSSL
ncbi:unnamed protein product [Durusdinium trenchii]|uniref:Uncharacterized protein n=2 Tax=Durusdinium trenchii TaxID=1381693 RepID=A0ABP0PLH9_9DINO